MVKRSDRPGERIAVLIARRLGAARNDNTPMLLAFVTRALPDTAFTAWYDHETDDIAGLVDDLVGRLCAIVGAMPAKFTKVREIASLILGAVYATHLPHAHSRLPQSRPDR